ncbi:purine-nucleoside phosphorylase [Campylobacter sp. CX2-4080-23]|uniref:phosphorylase family protein n=1 Tax=Campylobacter porcelli TaxID=1660073 RepID=UPI002ECE43C4|nr:purine-nucleoside phosphorylase [Campylobacter sp. CX2-4080-23]
MAINSSLNSDILIVCAGAMESFEFAKSIGIGMVEPAINLTKILLNSNRLPKKIIFIGSCGLYGDEKLLEIYKSTQACNYEIAGIMGLGYTPIDMKIAKVSQETNIINSSNFITNSKDISIKFKNLGFMAENMEAYAIWCVAMKFNIDFELILCATNYCDENAHNDFIKNYPKAKENITKYLKSEGII